MTERRDEIKRADGAKARRERLAKELRANLMRRKAQTRTRGEATATSDGQRKNTGQEMS